MGTEFSSPPEQKPAFHSCLPLFLILLLMPASLFFYDWSKAGLSSVVGWESQWILPLVLGTIMAALVVWFLNRQHRQLKSDFARLRQQHAIVQEILQNIPDHLAVIDRDYRIHLSNWKYEYVPEEQRLNNPLCYEAYYPEQVGPCKKCHVREVYATGKPVVRLKNNPHVGIVEIRAFPILDSCGEVMLVAEQICDVSHHVQAEKALRISEEKLQVILHSIDDPIRVVDKDLNVIWANNASRKIFDESLLSQKCCALYEQRINQRQAFSCPTKAALADGKTHERILELVTTDGEVHFFKTASHVIRRNDDHQPSEVLEVFWDVTQIKRAEEALRESEMLFRTVVESSKDAMIAIDPLGRITLFNSGAERIFGYTKDEVLNGAVEQLMTEEYRFAHRKNIVRFFSGNGSGNAIGKTVELNAMRKNGAPFPIELSLSAGQMGSERFVLAVIRDITERKIFEEQLIHQANHDGLTGLPNRTLLLDRLRQAIALDQHNQNKLAVLLLDLDKFKTVNDTLGHSGGNSLLKEVALRLSSVVSSMDTVGRLYGDEFVIILNGMKDTEGLLRTVRSIEQSFDTPFYIGDSQLLIFFSLGIALFPDDGISAEELLRKADTAMYSAKERGKNTFNFFTPQLEERIRKRLQMEKLLQNAIINREFFLHYQPRVEPESGRIVGLEALLRWTPEGHAPIPPDVFVPILEETGWIKDVGQWILTTACHTAKTWQDRGLGPIRVWVNISGKQFLEKTFFENIEQILLDTGLEAPHLGLELTETVLMEDVEGHIEKLEKLKQLGLLISIDDFGTGYSSLSYLKRFPIDEIKIDRSFVDGLMKDENDTVIVRTILAMSRSLGLRVVAEGVETREQLDFLVSHLCDEVQGYLFSKPLSSGDVERLLFLSPSSSQSGHIAIPCGQEANGGIEAVALGSGHDKPLVFNK